MKNPVEINLKEFGIIIDSFKNTEGPLIPILHKAEKMYGYIPIEIQNLISEKLKMSNATIYGVATFYAMFHTEPTGKYHIGVCTGTTCHLNGSSKLLKHLEQKLGIVEGETTIDGQFTIVPVKCIGNCDLAPNMTVNGKVYNSVTINKIDNLIKEYSSK
ncbi:MAG: NADH-quinone oxidoreductase subunit NuoE [Candidatus Izimaplasma sp.]|nr:NADH-quinone oxidoreductase subunit NuoE [Candidatus Izimaplasma bacterium]